MCCKKTLVAFRADACCAVSNKLTAEENGRKFRFQFLSKSKEKICRIKVDGCLIDDSNTVKCDYLFQRCTSHEFYFVELKGKKGLKHAYEQIKATLQTVKKNLGVEKTEIPKEKIFGCIVSSKVPKDINVLEMKEDFRKRYGKKLEISSTSPYTWALKELKKE